MIKVTAPSALFTPDSPFFSFITWASNYGYKVTPDANGNSIINLPADGSFTIAQALQVVASGGEVEGYPIYIEMTQTKYEGNVPAGIRGREEELESGATNVLTWQEWADRYNRSFNKIGTKQYIEASDGNSYLKGSEVAVLGTGYSLLTVEEYVAKLPVAELDD